MSRFQDNRQAGPAANEADDAPVSFMARLGWFIVYWIGGVAVVATVAYAIRAVLL